MIVLQHRIGVGMFGGAFVDTEIPIGELLGAYADEGGLWIIVFADDLRPAFARWRVLACAPEVAYPELAPHAQLLCRSDELRLYFFRQPAP